MSVDSEVAASDAELARKVRELGSDAAVEELYRRHRSATLAYARMCCRDAHTAEDLASEAFARTLQAVRRGGGPEAAWRPYLLTVVRRIAAEWATTARHIELAPDFEQWLANLPENGKAESSEERILRLEDSSLVMKAFRSLPERWQAVLWHSVVENEPASRVGILLGVGASGVGSLASRAREGLREAYLVAHAESASSSGECRRFTGLLGAAVRRTGRRRSKDLERHLAQCDRCRAALMELADLNARLGAALPVGVLLWGGSGYVAAHLAEGGAGTAGGALFSGTPDGGAGWWSWVTRTPLRSGGLAGGAVLAVGLAVLVLPAPLDDDGNGFPPAQSTSGPTVAGPEGREPVAHEPTPSTDASSTAAPPTETSPTPEGRPSSPSVTPSTTPKPSPSPSWNGIYRVTNVGSGKVLNVPNASRDWGTQLDQRSSAAVDHQNWRFTPNADGTYEIVNAASGLAMNVTESRMSSGTPVIQYPLDGADNSKWIVTGDGRILAKHSRLSLTVAGPSDGDVITQADDTGSKYQRWTIG
ncbi:sigma-70 family RNA polymerase sigma factor [Streptomyces sp. NBC_01092]|uniref:sigma-70 family RNA polymerase sigma factor n=1 Tax=Streptomyces sp. NBC_01092 TaxID=2903748 RepID=UPI003868C8A2|nr:sigma-70 family RNA polymerase sigma factor [Streptomyces sp. NBC_01092]